MLGLQFLLKHFDLNWNVKIVHHLPSLYVLLGDKLSLLNTNIDDKFLLGLISGSFTKKCAKAQQKIHTTKLHQSWCVCEVFGEIHKQLSTMSHGKNMGHTP